MYTVHQLTQRMNNEPCIMPRETQIYGAIFGFSAKAAIMHAIVRQLNNRQLIFFGILYYCNVSIARGIHITNPTDRVSAISMPISQELNHRPLRAKYIVSTEINKNNPEDSSEHNIN